MIISENDIVIGTLSDFLTLIAPKTLLKSWVALNSTIVRLWRFSAILSHSWISSPVLVKFWLAHFRLSCSSKQNYLKKEYTFVFFLLFCGEIKNLRNNRSSNYLKLCCNKHSRRIHTPLVIFFYKFSSLISLCLSSTATVSFLKYNADFVTIEKTHQLNDPTRRKWKPVKWPLFSYQTKP